MRKQEVVTFQKIKVKRKNSTPKRDDWKRDRKAQRNAKRIAQEKMYA
jgi:hypothetical protein